MDNVTILSVVYNKLIYFLQIIKIEQILLNKRQRSAYNPVL